MTGPLLPYAITICGLSELCEHTEAGVTHVLTIIDPDCPDPDDFRRYAPHRRAVRRFHDTIREDPAMVPPTPADVSAILAFGETVRAEAGRHLLIHCHMGISRSTAAAAILLAQHNPGREAEVFRELTAVRSWNWPNSRMIGFADRLLGRDGALVAALRVHHYAIARALPQRAEELLETERIGELPPEISGV
jgi:predicted protein tyrosine phosphatase